VFLHTVRRVTDDRRVAIFIDNVGAPVHRATVKALARQGVIATSGWDGGGALAFDRITACMNRHLHVHTHGVRHAVAVEAYEYMADSAWMPKVGQELWPWEQIPELAHAFTAGELESYFPVFEVNPELA
jgi:NADPH:quinone reductase-like Zn-dependent oxidoreductase